MGAPFPPTFLLKVTTEFASTESAGRRPHIDDSAYALDEEVATIT